jgi:hypothetical protein
MTSGSEVDDDRSSFVTRAVDWLRRGYPSGVPRQDYVIILSLLQRKLTEVKVRKIAENLAEQSVIADEPLFLRHAGPRESLPAPDGRLSPAVST